MKFEDKTIELLREGRVLKINLVSPSTYSRMDGLVSTTAVNNIAKGLRQINEDLEDEFEPDEILAYAYTLIDKIIREG